MPILGVRIDSESRAFEDAVISVTDEGLLRGDGVFEVLHIYAGWPFALDEHIDRMTHSAAVLRLPFDAAAARAETLELASLAGESDALIRLVQTRGGRLIAMLESLPQLPVTVRLATVVYSPPVLLNGVKSISYAANSLASRLAVERDADQALLVSPDGHVLEGPNFAAFFAFGNHQRFCTPPLDEGILDSITRRHLMKLFSIEERRIHIDELADAREAFIGSSIREVLPVSHIDGAPLASAPGRLTSNAAMVFGEHVRSEAESVAQSKRGGE